MKMSFRAANTIFLVLFIGPILAMGIFVNQRIQQRQSVVQTFLQNQVDVDRKIVTERGRLQGAQTMLRRAAISTKILAEQQSLAVEIRDERNKFEKFWKEYGANYSAKSRPLLTSILTATQESDLIEEEERLVMSIQSVADAYYNAIFRHPIFHGEKNLSLEENLVLLDEIVTRRDAVFGALNELVDIRYIFAQRIVFFVSGENAAQQGFFNTIFLGILLSVAIVGTVQYFILVRPLGDIMLFLSDWFQGKKGQRLYFSSPIKEIRASEEIINQVVGEAEEHEEHERKI